MHFSTGGEVCREMDLLLPPQENEQMSLFLWNIYQVWVVRINLNVCQDEIKENFVYHSVYQLYTQDM